MVWWFTAALAADFDGDGVEDFQDNCGTVANPTQDDRDGDDFGDACDACKSLQGFAAPVDLVSGGIGGRLQAVDVDGDGDADLLAQSATGLVWLEQTGGTLAAPVVLAPAVAVFVAADFDGDGDADLASVTTELVWQENVSGVLGPSMVVGPAPAMGLGGLPTLVADDIDGDGALDLVVAALEDKGFGATDGDVRWYRWTGSGFGAEQVVHDAAPAVRAGDLDGDGDGDLVVVGSGVVVLDNVGTGFLARAPLGEAAHLEIADLDGDGDPDLLGERTGPSSPVVAWLNDGAGGFDEAVALGQTSGRARGVALADLDRDGDLDLLELTWLEGVGNAMLGVPRPVAPQVDDAEDVVAVDVDDDGWLDAVAIAGDDLVWMRNELLCTPAPSSTGDTGPGTPTADTGQQPGPAVPTVADDPGRRCGCDGTGAGGALAVALGLLAARRRHSRGSRTSSIT